MSELNPNVRVNVLDNFQIEDLANYHVVVFTEMPKNIKVAIEIDEFCRSKNIGFILA